MVQWTYDTVQPVKEVFKRKRVGYSGEVVAENGDIEHCQKARQNGPEAVKGT